MTVLRISRLGLALVAAAAVAIGPGASPVAATDAGPGDTTDPIATEAATSAQRGRDAWAETGADAATPTPAASTTTTTTPSPPPEESGSPEADSGRIADDILIGLALEIRNFAPPAWTASEESALRARLEATDLSRAVRIGALRDDRGPVTDVLGSFTRSGPSLRSQFAPAAILGAILAWALITGLETRRKRVGKRATQ